MCPAERNLHGRDAELVARVRGGDREAFGELVGHYIGPARRVARAVLRDADDADDAVQDAFLNALTRLEQYDARRPFGPWLLRIVANAALDRVRRRTIRAAEPISDRQPQAAAGPAEDAERRMMLAELERALQALPERRRLAVVLFDVEGYEHKEIAKILGVPEGTVRSDVFHARRHLREALSGWRESADG